MARTLESIKAEMTDAWMQNQTLASAYGYHVGDNWAATFSKVSLENLICYIMAAAIWTHEKLFDAHRAEVDDLLAQMKPHSLRWYVNKTKAYRHGQALIEGTDQYADHKADGTALTEADIDSMQVVKFAAASEGEGTIYLKVAGEKDGSKCTLTNEQLNGLTAYLGEVKDAGVQVMLVNSKACSLKLVLDIYYNPLVLSGTGQHLIDGNYPVKEAIKAYIENLPFNGEYRNAALIDALQQVEGVAIPELKKAQQSEGGDYFEDIDAKDVPRAGYYAYDENNVTLNYKAYVSN